jgi:HD domain-containing protein/GAF domain-containing protein
MKRHVDVGADILSAIDFPYPVVPIVRCHHENWDGSGYPRGVQGTDIPIGARILSVVDCYDALTSDRPYRRALSRDEAIAILRERRGTTYDPLVVDTFIRVLPDIPEGAIAPLPHTAALVQISQSAVAPAVAEPTGPVLENPPDVADLLAELVSLAKVVTAASSLPDVLTLATATLRRVVGGGTCAIYLLSGDGRRLVLEHASGPLAASLAGTSIPIGQKLTGWVAAYRRTIVNSDAQLDLCDVMTGDSVPHTCLSTALGEGDALTGVMTVYREAEKPFTPADGRAAETLAPHLARMLVVLRPSPVAAWGDSIRAARDLRVVGGRIARSS